MMRLGLVQPRGFVRGFLSVGVAMLVVAFAATPVQAQDGAFMWSQATVGGARDKITYYSGFYSAGPDQAEAKAKARAFKSELEDMELSALAVSAKCMALADYDTAVASRDTAMRAAPGEVLND